MAYIIIAEFRQFLEANRLRGLSDDTGAAVNDSVLNDVIADASSVMDSYLAVRYSVPLSSTPRVVRDNCVSIASYILHSRRPWTVSEDVRQKYEDAIKWLKDIASGKALIPGLTEDSAKATGAYFDAETRIFQGGTHDRDGETDKFGGF